MESKHLEVLRAHRLYLGQQLVIEDTIIQYLYQEDILTESLVEEIQSQSCNKKKTLTLLNALPHRGPNAFSAFIKALQPNFPWITEKLLLSVQHQFDSAENMQSATTGKRVVIRVNIYKMYSGLVDTRITYPLYMLCRRNIQQ